MKHYHLCAAVQGLLIGLGCYDTFGPIGGAYVALFMAGWGIISAIDMEHSREPTGGKQPQ